MRIYVRTRGRDLGYEFLGEAPRERWWHRYDPVNYFERPTILVESDGRSWRAYIAGIRSQRLDSIGTPIQFNLVLVGECTKAAVGEVAAGATGDQDPDRVGAERALALSVIGHSVTDLGEHEEFIAGNRLDSRLTPEDVERMLTSPGEATLAEAADAVRAAYGADSGPQANRPQANGESVPTGDWLGGVANPHARAMFGALAARLMDGKPGHALVLNLVRDERDIERLCDVDGHLGILIVSPEPFRPLEPIRPPASAPGVPLPGPPAGAPPGPRFLTANAVGRVGDAFANRSRRVSGPAQDLRESWFRRVLRGRRSRRDDKA